MADQKGPSLQLVIGMTRQWNAEWSLPLIKLNFFNKLANFQANGMRVLGRMRRITTVNDVLPVTYIAKE